MLKMAPTGDIMAAITNENKNDIITPAPKALGLIFNNPASRVPHLAIGRQEITQKATMPTAGMDRRNPFKTIVPAENNCPTKANIVLKITVINMV
jgi:hypothetical protein